ncbi:glycosyltransferase family 4 protein [archaeon]|nr:glycosyltransferase family 4 protein [archaeon]
MKICYLSQSFYPYVGGVSDYLRDLARELTKDGIEVHEVTFKTKDTPSFEEFEGIKIHRFLKDRSTELLEGYGRFKENMLKATHKQKVRSDVLARRESYGFKRYMRINERARKKLLSLHRRENFDIIHIQDFQFLPMGHLLEGNIDVPVAFTWHVPFVPEIPGDWKEFFVNYMEDYQRCILSTDEYLETAVNAGLQKEKCVRIYPFVDLRRYRPEGRGSNFKKKHGLEDNRIILCVSRLDPRKGQKTLINAIPKVVKQLPDTKVVFVGNGSITKEMIGGRSKVLGSLKRLASERGVKDKVIFTGYVPEEELKGAFEAADAVVQPSLMEAFGLTITQAMSFRKPVIGTNVGGIKVQIKDKETGFLFEPGDHKALSNHLISLLKNPDMASEMGRKGKKRIKGIADVSVGKKAHLKLYENLTAR